MKKTIIWIPLLALVAACSSTPSSPTGSSVATGARPQAFSVADQPTIGDPAISRPTDAPTEFTIAQNSASTGAIFEWRKRANTVRWQLEIVRHDPTDQPFSISVTVDDRPAYEWRPAANLLNRSYDARVRAAWPSGEVSAWTTWKTFSIGARAVATADCWDWRLGPRVPAVAFPLPTCNEPRG